MSSFQLVSQVVLYLIDPMDDLSIVLIAVASISKATDRLDSPHLTASVYILNRGVRTRRTWPTKSPLKMKIITSIYPNIVYYKHEK